MVVEMNKELLDRFERLEQKNKFLNSKVDELTKRDKEREAETMVLYNVLRKTVQGLALRRSINLSPFIEELEAIKRETITERLPEEIDSWLFWLHAINDTLSEFV